MSRAKPSTPRSPLAGSSPSGTLWRSLRPSRTRQTPALASRSAPLPRLPHTNTTRGGVRKWAGNITRFLLVQSPVNHHNPASQSAVRYCYSLGGDVTDASTPALTPLRAVCKGNTAVKRAAGRSQ